MSQFALSLDNAPSLAPEDYVLSTSNQAAYDQLMAWPNWPDYAFWLYGPAHSGKSHLAAVWTAYSHAISVTPQQLENIEEVLQEPSQAFVLDSISQPSDAMQHGLFHLLNHVKQASGHVLLISDTPPSQQPLSLPDLQSRLKALPTLSLCAPDDELLRAVWFKLFADRQLQVTPAVIDYLMQRSERSFAAIHQTIARLDHAALEQKRDITIPFVRSLLIEPENFA